MIQSHKLCKSGSVYIIVGLCLGAQVQFNAWALFMGNVWLISLDVLYSFKSSMLTVEYIVIYCDKLCES